MALAGDFESLSLCLPDNDQLGREVFSQIVQISNERVELKGNLAHFEDEEAYSKLSRLLYSLYLVISSHTHCVCQIMIN